MVMTLYTRYPFHEKHFWCMSVTFIFKVAYIILSFINFPHLLLFVLNIIVYCLTISVHLNVLSIIIILVRFQPVHLYFQFNHFQYISITSSVFILCFPKFIGELKIVKLAKHNQRTNQVMCPSFKAYVLFCPIQKNLDLVLTESSHRY